MAASQRGRQPLPTMRRKDSSRDSVLRELRSSVHANRLTRDTREARSARRSSRCLTEPLQTPSRRIGGRHASGDSITDLTRKGNQTGTDEMRWLSQERLAVDAERT